MDKKQKRQVRKLAKTISKLLFICSECGLKTDQPGTPCYRCRNYDPNEFFK